MARIAGIDLPKNKRGVVGLTYIYGIGRTTAAKILTANGIDLNTKVKDWNDLHEISYIISNVGGMCGFGALDNFNLEDIKPFILNNLITFFIKIIR